MKPTTEIILRFVHATAEQEFERVNTDPVIIVQVFS